MHRYQRCIDTVVILVAVCTHLDTCIDSASPPRSSGLTSVPDAAGAR